MVTNDAHAWWKGPRGFGYVYGAATLPLIVLIFVVGFLAAKLQLLCVWAIKNLNAFSLPLLRLEFDRCGSRIGSCERCDLIRAALGFLGHDVDGPESARCEPFPAVASFDPSACDCARCRAMVAFHGLDETCAPTCDCAPCRSWRVHSGALRTANRVLGNRILP